MRILLLILKRSRILLLFILLEAVAFSLIFNQRSFQRATFLGATNIISGQINQNLNNLSNYLNLKVENENLVKENVRLRNLLDRSKIFQSYGADTISDSTYSTRYSITNAKIISGSYAKFNNYLNLDKGEKSGIKPNMGVAGPNGVVGIISATSANFSAVIPLINPSLTLSAKLKKTGYFGPLKWDGINYRHAIIEDIPRYANFENGDTVVTDSRSRIFPPGLMIGTIIGKKLQSDQNFYAVKIRLSTDFSKLEHVYVIKDKMKAELDSLNDLSP
jgi:rod shape-determining protein MreC